MVRATRGAPAREAQPVDGASRRAHLVIKPVPVPELGGDPIPHLVRRLEEAGITCDVTITQPDRPVVEDVQLALAASPRPDFVIAGGGDGTHGPVGASLVGTGVPLGLISLGTFNNIARSVGIPRDVDAALDVIIAGHLQPVDAGKVNDRVFFEVAGAGWDATLFPVGEELKQGNLGALLSSARSVLGYQMDPITLLLDAERQITAITPTVVVANGPYYGSSFAVAPTSQLDDGKLTVTVFESLGKAELLAYFASVAEGQPLADPRVVSYRAGSVEIVSPPDLPAHADGQPIGQLYTPFEALPNALQVFAPAVQAHEGDQQTMKWSVADVAAAGTAPETPTRPGATTRWSADQIKRRPPTGGSATS